MFACAGIVRIQCIGVCLCMYLYVCIWGDMCVITVFHSKTTRLSLSFRQRLFNQKQFLSSFPRETLPLLLQSQKLPANTRWSEIYALYMLIAETVNPRGGSYPISLLKRARLSNGVKWTADILNLYACVYLHVRDSAECAWRGENTRCMCICGLELFCF